MNEKIKIVLEQKRPTSESSRQTNPNNITFGQRQSGPLFLNTLNNSSEPSGQKIRKQDLEKFVFSSDDSDSSLSSHKPPPKQSERIPLMLIFLIIFIGLILAIMGLALFIKKK